LVLCAAALIINLDNTILNVALPTLVRSLHATSSQLQWIVDSYAMVFAGLLLVGGSLADRLGRRRFFLCGLTIFAAGSCGAALSGSVDLLIAFRAVMGAGAALTIPSSLSIVNDVFRDPKERAQAIGAWGGTIGLGIAIGPIAGGLLLARFWWGSIFLVNVPIVIAAFVGAALLVPDSKNPSAARPDPGGAALSILGLGALLWAIIEGPTRGWSSPSVLVAGGMSVITIGSFVVWESRSNHPMLKLSFFRDRRFSIAATAELLGVFGLMGALFLQTQFLQFDLGYSPLQAGIRILPTAATLVVAALLSPLIARRIGVKRTVATALVFIAGGLWQISTTSSILTTYGDVLPGLLLIGIGAGLLLPTATNSVVGAVPQGDSGMGSAINAVALQTGGALGVAVIGSVAATRYKDHMSAALTGRHLPETVSNTIMGSIGGALGVARGAGGDLGRALATSARTAFMSGLEVSFIVGSAVAIGGVLIVFALLPTEA
jgi:EmrB/QacA subfamily drug resistance transporter